MATKDSLKIARDFNSRSVLHDVKHDEDTYYPFDHRDKIGGNSTTGSLIHLLKSSLGTGILAMPMAFKNGGIIFAGIGTLLIGFICTHCVHILVRTSHDICVKARQPALGFAETAEEVFKHSQSSRIQKLSGFARQFVDWGIILTYFSAGCVYIVFIATSIGEVVNYYIKAHHGDIIDIRYYILMAIVPLLIIGQIKQLKYLVPFSAIANLCLIVSFSITLYYLLKSLQLQDLDKLQYMGEFNNLPIFFSTVIFAMEGIGVVMPVENSMKKPQHFLGCPGVLNFAMGIVIILYATIGFFGYWCYGLEVKGSVTENLPVEEKLAQAVKILIGLSILFTFGLQFYVPTSLLWGKIENKISKTQHSLVQILMRVVIIFLMLGLSLAVPNLEPFIGLVGAIFFSILGLTVPSVVETVHRWNGNLGFAKWVLWKNLLLFLFSIFALVTGSIVSIQQIIELY